MNTNKDSIYNTVSGVSALNKTSQFDPGKYLKKIVCKATGEVTYDIELKYKKLWFRLLNPNGHVISTAIHITEQFAIIECKVFFDKDDEKPASGYMAQTTKETYGASYIQMAQYIAENEALSAAGFGCQFNDLRQDLNDTLVTVKEIPNAEKQAVVSAEESGTAIVPMTQEETAETISTPVKTASEAINAEAEKSEVQTTEQPPSRFTGMSADEIFMLMTRDEAVAVVVDIGNCKGLTLAEVLDKRPVSLRWLANGYTGDNNILIAGARLLQGELSAQQIAA